MNNDELDREIKLVQLQRERLALAREMAFQGVGGRVKNAGKTLGRAVVNFFRAIGSLFARWWLVIFCIALAAGCVAAVVAGLLSYQAETQRLAEERANAYAEKACPDSAFVSTDHYFSPDRLDKEREQRLCRYRALDSYAKKKPQPQPWFK